MLRVKSIITAYKAQVNPEIPGGVDILGVFDNLVQPVFPFILPNLSIVLTMEKLARPTMFEVRLNGPDDSLISKGEFGILPDPFGDGKKIIDLNEFIIGDRGRYTLDIFEKIAEDKVKFIETVDLFIADYPPQRRISDEEKDKILATDGVIKTVRTEFKLTPDSEPVKVQVNLDKNEPIDEGYMAIPENNRITIEDKVVDLTGIKRQIEWMFGNPLPDQMEKIEEEANENQEKEEKNLDIKAEN